MDGLFGLFACLTHCVLWFIFGAVGLRGVSKFAQVMGGKFAGLRYCDGSAFSSITLASQSISLKHPNAHPEVPPLPHAYTHAHAQARAHTHIHNHIHTCTHMQTHMHIHTSVHLSTYTRTYPQHALTLTHTPVSYTHLTLPTSCCV